LAVKASTFIVSQLALALFLLATGTLALVEVAFLQTNML
jgi:hypothetical protein